MIPGGGVAGGPAVQTTSSRQEYHRHLWVAVIAILYGTGLRRGELERLNLASWSAAEGTLRIDGRKTGQERQVVLPELAARCLESYLPHRHNHLEALKHLRLGPAGGRGASAGGAADAGPPDHQPQPRSATAEAATAEVNS